MWPGAIEGIRQARPGASQSRVLRSAPSWQTVQLETVHGSGLHRCQTGPPARVLAYNQLMAFVIPVADSNQHAMDLVAKRLQDDFPPLFQVYENQATAPFWVFCRALFPIAESLASLLLGGQIPDSTSQRLSRFLRDFLGPQRDGYNYSANIITQMWRHSLTHGDEPPCLVIDGQMSLSWALILNHSDNHLGFLAIGERNAQFQFSLFDFYEDLLAVALDRTALAGLAEDEVRDRYNSWTVKHFPIQGTRPSRSEQDAESELRALFTQLKNTAT